jgi:hypothetical protein
MTDAGPIGDDDIRAFGPSPWTGSATPRIAAATTAPRRRRRGWPWVLLAAFAVFVLLLAALAVPLGAALAELVRGLQSGVVVTVNGQRIVPPDLGSGEWQLVAAALLLALAFAAVIVPLAVAAGLAGAALGIGLALLVAFAPLWLAGWLLWRLLRRDERSGERPRAPAR